jgi:hypothetical protein
MARGEAWYAPDKKSMECFAYTKNIFGRDDVLCNGLGEPDNLFPPGFMIYSRQHFLHSDLNREVENIVKAAGKMELKHAGL